MQCLLNIVYMSRMCLVSVISCGFSGELGVVDSGTMLIPSSADDAFLFSSSAARLALAAAAAAALTQLSPPLLTDASGRSACLEKSELVEETRGGP